MRQDSPPQVRDAHPTLSSMLSVHHSPAFCLLPSLSAPLRTVVDDRPCHRPSEPATPPNKSSYPCVKHPLPPSTCRAGQVLARHTRPTHKTISSQSQCIVVCGWRLYYLAFTSTKVFKQKQTNVGELLIFLFQIVAV